jgi:hypothetical protein
VASSTSGSSSVLSTVGVLGLTSAALFSTSAAFFSSSFFFRFSFLFDFLGDSRPTVLVFCDVDRQLIQILSGRNQAIPSQSGNMQPPLL